jgi:hypothetical protein
MHQVNHIGANRSEWARARPQAAASIFTPCCWQWRVMICVKTYTSLYLSLRITKSFNRFSLIGTGSAIALGNLTEGRMTLPLVFIQG